MTPAAIPLEEAYPRAPARHAGVAKDQFILTAEQKLCFRCPTPMPKCLGRFCPITLHRRARDAFEAEDTAAFLRLSRQLRKTRERFMVGA